MPALKLQRVDIKDIALNDTLYYVFDLSYMAVDIGLSSVLFGVLTFLVILAVIFLIRKGLSYTAVRVLLPSTLLLYGSTALYMGTLASHVTSVARLTAQARAGLLSRAYTDAYFQEFQSDVLKQSWMMTTALIVNILIGDSIVWWRVCVVWRHWVVICAGPLLILITCGVLAITCASLSFGINVLATGLIGYKTWTHWQLLRENLGRGSSRSLVLKMLVLLVESGTVYCLFLIIVVAYEASPSLFAAPEVHQSMVLRIVADYTYACYIHVMAIYPIVIIVIVALNSSPIDHGFTDGMHLGNENPSSSLANDQDLSRAALSTGTVVAGPPHTHFKSWVARKDRQRERTSKAC